MRASGLLFLGMAMGALPTATADLYRVTPNGQGDFPTIEAAIIAAGDGDLILLGDGIFTGEGNRDVDFLGKEIVVRSESTLPERCIIDCQGTDADPHRGFLFRSAETSGARLQYVTIRNGNVRYAALPRGGALLISNAACPTISGCIFEANEALYGGAVATENWARPFIGLCLFDGNIAYYGGGGIRVHTQSRPDLYRCTFWRNVTPGYGAALACEYALTDAYGCTFSGNICYDSSAIGLFAAGGLVLANSIVAFTARGLGILCEDGYAQLSCCDVYGNEQGDWVACIADQYGTDGNIWADPLFCRPEDGRFTLQEDSPCAPHTPPNDQCDRIGAWEIDCDPMSAPLPGEVDAQVQLLAIRPNPLSAGTRVSLAVPVTVNPRPLRLTLLDASGRRVRTLLAGSPPPGIHELPWDGCDEAGRPVPAGIYFCRLAAGRRQEMRRMLVVR